MIYFYPWLPIQGCGLFIDSDTGKDALPSPEEQLGPTELLAKSEKNLKYVGEDRDDGLKFWLKSNSQECSFFLLNLLL